MRLGDLRSHGLRTKRGAAPVLLFLSALAGGSCAAPADEPVQAAAQKDTPQEWTSLDIKRSVAITDLPTLEAVDENGNRRFTLYRVLQKIAETSGATHPPSPEELYQRIWDNNNTKAHSYVHDGQQHCDDHKDAHGNYVINGYPIQCPRQEGALADLSKHNPFCTSPAGDPDPKCDPYTPIIITNRFDLAPANGQTCGQYRIAFGKGKGQDPLTTAGNPLLLNRTLMIFEAVLRNPHPEKGLVGCAKVVEYWAALSGEDDPAKRAEALDYFFFHGLKSFGPAIRYNNFTGKVDAQTGVQLSGQIRTNGFMFDEGGQPWQLREYNTGKHCTGSGSSRTCQLRVKMVMPKVNPYASLFDDNNTSPDAQAFQDPNNPGGFIAQIPSLLEPDINLINMNGLSANYNGGQSTSSPTLTLTGGPFDDTNYLKAFNPKGAFAAKIQAKLDALGSNIPPLGVVRRAQTQACAGCHELSTKTAFAFGGAPPSAVTGLSEGGIIGNGMVWPEAALGVDTSSQPGGFPPINSFTQTSEVRLLPLQSGVTCDTTCTADPTHCQCEWDVSPALRDVFLPFRRKNMEDYLAKYYAYSGVWSLADSGPKAATMLGSPDN
jgi:hypothetical protein